MEGKFSAHYKVNSTNSDIKISLCGTPLSSKMQNIVRIYTKKCAFLKTDDIFWLQKPAQGSSETDILLHMCTFNLVYLDLLGLS
jgi:hypothetical protein